MYSKYSFHRRLTLRLLCIALCACMALNGCSSTSLPDDTLSSEQEETESSVSSSEDSAYTYSDYELDDSFDRQSAASITLSGSTAQSNGSGVSINNATPKKDAISSAESWRMGKSSSMPVTATRFSWFWTRLLSTAPPAAPFWFAMQTRSR